MRIANAIEMYHADSENITPSFNTSGISNETHDISNIPTVQNESMDFEKSFQSMEIDKSIETLNNENTKRVTKTAEARWRFQSDMTETNIEDDFQKCTIKDDTKLLNTDQTVSVNFKNQKPVDLQKFKYLPQLKISLQNNKIPEKLEENNNQRETENRKPLFRKTDPRLEMRKSNDSIFEFCKEKTKEPPTTEFENGKKNMASQNQKIIFEFESGQTYMASQYDRTTSEDQNGKTMSSQNDGSKSNMASTSNSLDASKPQTMMNRIDLNRFHVRSKDMEQRLRARMDEWVCFYSQVMEDALATILQKHSPSGLTSPPPCSLLEALRSVDAAHEEQATVRKIVSHLCSCLFDSTDKMKKFIHPEEFMRALGCGAKLLEYLEIILPSIDIQDGVSALQALLTQIEDDTDPTTGLSEPLVITSLNSKTDELDVRQNFVKDTSEVVAYLKKHFAAWENYNPSQDIKVFRTSGKKEIKLEKIRKVSDRENEETIDRNGRNNAGNGAVADSTKTNNVQKYCCDKNNVDDINHFELDRDKNIVVRKENYDKNKTRVVNNRNKHVQNNIDVYKPKKARDGKVQYEKDPIIIKKVGILKEFETKPRKRKTKPVHVDIKPVKKTKIDVKSASNDKNHNETTKKYAKVNSNPKNTVYRPEKDPKLIYSPKVIIEANLIRDYEEKMRVKKAKKLQTEEEEKNHCTKTDNEHNKYSLNPYNGINNNHTVTKKLKESDSSDHNDNQVTKIKNNHYIEHNDNHNDDNNNHNEDNDNHNKDVTTDSGLGNELPRWSSVVDSYTTEIEKSLSFILRNMNSALATFREDSVAETFRMRAFEMDYLTCRILAMLRSLLLHRTDEDERARNLDAVAKCMAQAKCIHNVVNSILSVTNYLLPVSSDLSLNF